MTVMTQESVIKDFYDWTEDDLRTNLPAGNYHLKVTKSSVGEWDDGRPRLDIQTEILSGEHVGMYGPRHTWNAGEFSGTANAGTDSERKFTITAEQNAKLLVRNMQAIHQGELSISNPGLYNKAMFEEIASQLVDDEFIASVKTNRKGYDTIGRFFSVSEPPDGFMTDGELAEWSL